MKPQPGAWHVLRCPRGFSPPSVFRPPRSGAFLPPPRAFRPYSYPGWSVDFPVHHAPRCKGGRGQRVSRGQALTPVWVPSGSGQSQTRADRWQAASLEGRPSGSSAALPEGPRDQKSCPRPGGGSPWSPGQGGARRGPPRCGPRSQRRLQKLPPLLSTCQHLLSLALASRAFFVLHCLKICYRFAHRLLFILPF